MRAPSPDRTNRPCFVAPSPELRDRLQQELGRARGRSKGIALAETVGLAPQPRAMGLDDGVIIPPRRVRAGHPRGANSRGGRGPSTFARGGARRCGAGRL